jgi:hypothetical protein
MATAESSLHTSEHEEFRPMSSTTMHAAPATTRSVPTHTRGVGHMLPILVAIALLAASAVASVLIAGPMH